MAAETVPAATAAQMFDAIADDLHTLKALLDALYEHHPRGQCAATLNAADALCGRAGWMADRAAIACGGLGVQDSDDWLMPCNPAALRELEEVVDPKVRRGGEQQNAAKRSNGSSQPASD